MGIDFGTRPDAIPPRPTFISRFALPRSQRSVRQLARFLAVHLIFVFATAAGLRAWAASTLAPVSGGVDQKQLKTLTLEQWVDRGDDGEQVAHGAVGYADGCVCDYGRGYSALGCDFNRGCTAAGSRGGSGAAEFHDLGGRYSRDGEQLLQVRSGSDRRKKRLYASVRGGVLGRAGYAAGKHRSDRGDPGAGRNDLGTERGERCHQHHHQKGFGNAWNDGHGAGGDAGSHD